MKISLLIASMLVFGVAASGPGTAQAGPNPVQNDKPEAGCTLRIHVDGLRNSTGVVGAVIFASPDGWPENTDKSLHHWPTEIPAGKREATAIWENLPPGNYGVAVIHDENRNRKLDRNFHWDSEGGFWICEQSSRGTFGAGIRCRQGSRDVPCYRDHHPPAIQVIGCSLLFASGKLRPRTRLHVFEDRLEIAVFRMRGKKRRGDEVLSARVACASRER